MDTNPLFYKLADDNYLGTLTRGPLFCAGFPKNATIVTSQLEPCTKCEPTNIIKAKGLETIDKYPKDDFVFAYIYRRSGGRFLTKTIARLRRGHHIGMNFDRDSRRTYRNCDNSLDTELTPAHIFDCPATLAALQ
ncbi:UNVERIFIED_CONTAM: hypothetical protein NCL1_42302 [Trichonephila clavipes]